MQLGQMFTNLVHHIKQHSLIAFACNVKCFAIAIIFFFFFFSTANLDGLTKVACQIVYIY